MFVCISRPLLLTGDYYAQKTASIGGNVRTNVYEVLQNIGNERVKRMDGLKRVITTMALCLTAVFAYSQVWTAQDSFAFEEIAGE